MALEVIIARYGLAAICLGAGIEGETAVMAGGVLAHQRLLSLPSVAGAAMLGSFVADQCFFSVGRHFRDRPYVQGILSKPTAHRALALLERHPNLFILAIRFLYGIRTLSPVAVGTSDVARTRFMALNAAAAIFWALLFTTIGYELGDGLRALFRRVHPYSHVLLGALVITLALLFALRRTMRYFHHRLAVRAGAAGSPS